MRRTQLYLEDDLWQMLHKNAAQSGTTVSNLVRRAVREQYLGADDARRKAMLEAVGLWSDQTDSQDSTALVRTLRKGSRLGRLKAR